jgi:hypothetical protein
MVEKFLLLVQVISTTPFNVKKSGLLACFVMKD